MFKINKKIKNIKFNTRLYEDSNRISVTFHMSPCNWVECSYNISHRDKILSQYDPYITFTYKGLPLMSESGGPKYSYRNHLLNVMNFLRTREVRDIQDEEITKEDYMLMYSVISEAININKYHEINNRIHELSYSKKDGQFKVNNMLIENVKIEKDEERAKEYS